VIEWTRQRISSSVIIRSPTAMSTTRPPGSQSCSDVTVARRGGPSIKDKTSLSTLPRKPQRSSDGRRSQGTH
jgi:hypothetical protein